MAKKPEKSPEKPQEVPEYRRCPVCYHGLGGVGVAYCTQGNTRYYKCKNGCTTWTAIVKTEVRKIENRKVELSERSENGPTS